MLKIYAALEPVAAEKQLVQGLVKGLEPWMEKQWELECNKRIRRSRVIHLSASACTFTLHTHS
jgi:hypothetical protein